MIRWNPSLESTLNQEKVVLMDRLVTDRQTEKGEGWGVNPMVLKRNCHWLGNPVWKYEWRVLKRTTNKNTLTASLERGVVLD